MRVLSTMVVNFTYFHIYKLYIKDDIINIHKLLENNYIDIYLSIYI